MSKNNIIITIIALAILLGIGTWAIFGLLERDDTETKAERIDCGIVTEFVLLGEMDTNGADLEDAWFCLRESFEQFEEEKCLPAFASVETEVFRGEVEVLSNCDIKVSVGDEEFLDEEMKHIANTYLQCPLYELFDSWAGGAVPASEILEENFSEEEGAEGALTPFAVMMQLSLLFGEEAVAFCQGTMLDAVGEGAFGR